MCAGNRADKIGLDLESLTHTKNPGLSTGGKLGDGPEGPLSHAEATLKTKRA
jgi:hypothetical protein